MNRKQKIIVSVTGIFLVLLLLVGLTYAYFLTNITGNTNNKSILVSTANLAVVYGGDDSSIIGEGETIIPGTTFAPKTFTVTNQGNATTDYVVVIEILEGTSTFESNDFTYTLTCVSGCNGVDEATTFPIEGGVLVGNSIDVGETQNYAFTLTYEETGLNQTGDMNKSLEARINIKDISSINPYSENTSSLAYNIINNAIVGKTGTTLLASPITNIAASISKYESNNLIDDEVPTSSLCSEYYPWLIGDTASAAQSGSTVSSYEEAVGKYVYDQCDSWTKYLESYDASTSTLTFKSKEILDERTLSVTQDDLGTSYYYRGAVEDNYVTFADMCWRIVRIAGDGSIKLILEDQDQACSKNINGNWAIPTTTGGSTYTGNFGYTQYSSGSLTASDGTINANSQGVMDYLHGTTDSDKSMANTFKNFQRTFTTDELAKLKSGDWCIADSAYIISSDNNISALTSIQKLDYKVKGTIFFYDSNNRLTETFSLGYQPTLKCKGTLMNDWDDTSKTPMYVGTITADEVVYAGGKVHEQNRELEPNYYLLNEEFKKGSSGANKANSFWSLSPFVFSAVAERTFLVQSDGLMFHDYVDGANTFRPAVTLAFNTTITRGNGTISNPYIIE